MAQAPTSDVAEAAYVQIGASDCLTCHTSPSTVQILNTPHARQADERTPFASQACESCHGPSLDHISGIQSDGKRPAPGIIFGARTGTYPPSETTDQNKVCLDCHTGSDSQNWHGSQHQFADLSCSSCHAMHTVVDRVMQKLTEAEVCYQCHTDKRAQFNRPFSHPVQEGRMACTDCHNPHGAAGNALLTKNTVNETCYQCHAEKRGPYLWAHQPVQEDCTNCHNPHGTTQSAMLEVRPPFLCNMCHSEDGHPSNLRSGSGVPPLGVSANLLGRSCTNCHTQIHGTNHPSGSGLTR